MTKELPHFAAPRRSKSSDEWYTPDALVSALGDFDLDPATSLQRGSQLAREFFTVEDDGLIQPWRGRVWLNPPFSDIRPWIERMTEHGNGVLLCFSRTDAKWFVETVENAGGVFLLRGRIQFRRPGQPTPNQCPLGCVLIPFGEQNHEAIAKSRIDGLWLKPAPRVLAAA